MDFIEIKNLSFCYPNQDKEILKDINLTIKKGEFITIFGASGCGKTTLLKHIKKEQTPSGKRQGKVFISGKPVSETDFSLVGFVGQNPNIALVCDKVWSSLAFGLQNMGLKREEMSRRIAETSTFFGIHRMMQAKVHELSGGQKQLLNLASQIVMQPEILVLDEPTAQLDPISAENFLHTLSRINKETGTTIILSEHRLEDAIPLSDRIIAMEEGAILAFDTPKKVSNILAEKEHDLCLSLPSSVKVFLSCEHDKKREIPLTVNEGRTWIFDKEVKQIPYKKREFENEFALKGKGLFFRYEKNSADILRDLNLEVFKGEIFAILGGNGTGKSTLLNVLGGVKKAYGGKLFKDGKTAVLPQNPINLFTENTVFDDLKKISENEQNLEKIINFCEISDILERHPFDLSGGQIQRAALAMVLLTSPDILLLDEPTKGMDAKFKEKLCKGLKELAKKQMTVIMVSHDVEFCAKVADRCCMFFDNTISASGTPREFFGNNAYYTTASSRIARGKIKNIATTLDLILALGGNKNENK
ncbi:MAG: ATP-binding cassette domain-containing protein [Clostridia bacterium]|nr:ATP-binding cassette domain-containing protein [Clostridia bacterium]